MVISITAAAAGCAVTESAVGSVQRGLSSFEGSGNGTIHSPFMTKSAGATLRIPGSHNSYLHFHSGQIDRSIDRLQRAAWGWEPNLSNAEASGVACRSGGNAKRVERYFSQALQTSPKPEKGQAGPVIPYRLCFRCDAHVGQTSSTLPKWNSRTMPLFQYYFSPRRNLCYLCRASDQPHSSRLISYKPFDIQHTVLSFFQRREYAVAAAAVCRLRAHFSKLACS